jgi:flavodoxin
MAGLTAYTRAAQDTIGALAASGYQMWTGATVATVKALLMVYHSMTGGTQQMVEAAEHAAGACPSVRTRVLRAPEAHAADVLAADGYLFATPENLASMSGLMKDFFDRTYYPALERLNGRPYAVMICAGSDGRGAAQQIERIATGWRLKLIAPPLIVCTHAQSPEQILRAKQLCASELAACRELGATLAEGLSLGVF